MVLSKQSWIALGFGALGILGCGGADFEPTAQGETPAQGSANAKAAKTFLSLGDSIPFGYNPLIMPPFAPPPPASAFVGYPEVLASSGYQVTNASCPGETSGSFLDPTAPDNGCRSFKAYPPLSLHADYETTQIVFAVAAIQAKVANNDKFDFVTLNIGANDLFVLQNSCTAAPNPLLCIQSGLPGVVAAYSQHLASAYDQMAAAYGAKKLKGQFVGVTTYATNYNDQFAVGALTLMNNALAAFTSSKGGILADGYLEFQKRSTEDGGTGDACAAGLLIRKPDNTCDIHPSADGRKLLADTVLKALNEGQQ
jgi:lysophospholipase L1-like esterase